MVTNKENISPLNRYLLGSDLEVLEAKLKLSQEKGFFYTTELHRILDWDSEKSFEEFIQHCKTARTLGGSIVSSVPKNSTYLYSIVFYKGKYFVYFEQIDGIARLRSGGNSFTEYSDALQYLNKMIFEQEK